jgi:hypothetical protein
LIEEYLIRTATTADVAAITDLANHNTYSELSATEREEGFLTGRFEQPAVSQMVDAALSVVACYKQELAGFVINSNLPAAAYPPLVQTLALKLPEINYQNKPLAAYRYFYYGPVLVSQPHRGRGLLTRLFNYTRGLLRSRFDLGIAFIHAQNRNSLDIHTHHLGLKVVGQFLFAKSDYFILVFEVK